MKKTIDELNEVIRLKEDASRVRNWKRWGPYLSERQWGTVREDYSADGNNWTYFTHDHARSRAYRWGEDGLLGICDRNARLCFALALWNKKDPILKERLFGLTSLQGNHGEDVKEYYYYLDSLPTHSYMRALYKYPQQAFPYEWLVTENAKRSRKEREFELADTGIFKDGNYFDVFAEYAKNSPNDILIKITIVNRSSNSAHIDILPTLWFRNTWSWGRTGEGYSSEPAIVKHGLNAFGAEHKGLGNFYLASDADNGEVVQLLTDNETNFKKVFGSNNTHVYTKDAFHRYVVNNEKSAVKPDGPCTKAAFYFSKEILSGKPLELCFRLHSVDETIPALFGAKFDEVFEERRKEHEEFYAHRCAFSQTPDDRAIQQSAYSGLLWGKQFYYFAVREWLEGDPSQPAPAPSRAKGRNREWKHLYNRDVISMPDKWEYPWYAAWDLAFHMLPMSRVDPEFAKSQLILLLREWYMHPNGQIPAYEFSFSDVNPPVHAWAVWRVYKMSAPRGKRDTDFLARAFHKLLLNFTWWVNRKDVDGNNLFGGGFLGLDNIGVFDRRIPQELGGHLQQADATAWMAFYCGTMLSIALELARTDKAYSDVASKFFEHFVAITDAMNAFGGSGLWNKRDDFYYDQLHIKDECIPLKVRSSVGIIPLCAVEVIEDEVIDKLPGFKKRLDWFLENRAELRRYVSYMEHTGPSHHGNCLLAVPSRGRLERALRYVLDENEFLSPYGIRSLSKMHEKTPFNLNANGRSYYIQYEPGESRTEMFGGNSNWRGPIWFPINYLFIEALERYHHFYGDSFQVECPRGSGRKMNLKQVSLEIASRLVSLFRANEDMVRPYHGDEKLFFSDENWSNNLSFYEHFHGDTGRGLGASNQGWTALVALCVEKLARAGYSPQF